MQLPEPFKVFKSLSLLVGAGLEALPRNDVLGLRMKSIPRQAIFQYPGRVSGPLEELHLILNGQAPQLGFVGVRPLLGMIREAFKIT